MKLPIQSAGIMRVVLARPAQARIRLSRSPIGYKRCTEECTGPFDIYSNDFMTCTNFCKCVYLDDRSVFSCLIDILDSGMELAPI